MERLKKTIHPTHTPTHIYTHAYIYEFNLNYILYSQTYEPIPSTHMKFKSLKGLENQICTANV